MRSEELHLDERVNCNRHAPCGGEAARTVARTRLAERRQALKRFVLALPRSWVPVERSAGPSGPTPARRDRRSSIQAVSPMTVTEPLIWPADMPTGPYCTPRPNGPHTCWTSDHTKHDKWTREEVVRAMLPAHAKGAGSRAAPRGAGWLAERPVRERLDHSTLIAAWGRAAVSSAEAAVAWQRRRVRLTRVPELSAP